MVKVAFFDVDGTLVSHTQKAVPQSTKNALDALARKGILRVLATGRHMLELQMIPVAGMEFDGYITMNGQLTLDARGNVISGSPIVGEDKEVLLRLFREKEIPIVLVEKDRMYINFINDYVVSAQHAISTPLPEAGEYTGNELYLAIGYLGKEQEHILHGLLPGCKTTRWNEYGIDIYSASGGKAAGIRDYLAIQQIPLEETIAFGDGENDVDMLKLVHTGVAMGNADDCVKEIADYIAPSVDEDGICRALQALGVIESTEREG